MITIEQPKPGKMVKPSFTPWGTVTEVIIGKTDEFSAESISTDPGTISALGAAAVILPKVTITLKRNGAQTGVDKPVIPYLNNNKLYWKAEFAGAIVGEKYKLTATRTYGLVEHAMSILNIEIKADAADLPVPPPAT